MRARLAAVVILVSASAGAVDFAGRARAAVSAGADTNPRRDFISPDAGGTPTDLVLQGVANLSGLLQGERASLSGSYDVGARKFIFLSPEDTIIQSLQLDGVLWLDGGFALGVTGRARDRRGAEREYSDLGAELSIQFVPDAKLDFRIWAGAHRFIFWSGFPSSFFGPEGGVSARYRFNKRHSISIAGSYSSRTFNAYGNVKLAPPPPLPSDDDRDSIENTADACPSIPGIGDGCPKIRHDGVALVSLGYWYRGPVVLSVSYGFLDNSASESYGDSLQQHRLGLVFAAPLFWQVMAFIDINLRIAVYPDGISFPNILLDEDGENLSSGHLKLVRPFGEHFELEARYGIYYGRLPKNDFTYWRHVVSLGVGVHF